MEDNLVFALEERCSLNSTRSGQHLTIRSSWDRNEIVYESIDFSRLWSLTVVGKWEPFFISNRKVNMRLLRVLDLEDAMDVTNDDLEQIGKLLPRLKFLSLRGCREITWLPSSIGGLRQLQTLDIRHTSIVMLPPVITKLQKLQYLRAGTTDVWDWDEGVGEDRASSPPPVTNLPGTTIEDEELASENGDGMVMNLPTQGSTDSTAPVQPPAACSKARTFLSSLLTKLCSRGLDNGSSGGGVMVPAGIGKLAVLHTLGVVKVNARCSQHMAIFQELKKLTQLRKLGVSGINNGNIKEFCCAISDHAHLKSLSVEVEKDDDLDDNIPWPPKTVKRLKLYGCVNKLLPVWIGQLQDNLEKLKLDLTIEKTEEFRLIELSYRTRVGQVRIRPIQDGDLHFRGWHWRWGKVVEIQCSSVLHIKFDDGFDDDWWKIKVLKVHFSGGSQSSLHISGLSKLTRFMEVWLKGYTDTHKQDMQRQIDDMELWVQNQERPVLKLVQPRSS